MQNKPVIYRSSGWSLYPRVSRGDQCTIHPVANPSDVNENDIVFCEAQPGDRFYGHVAKEKLWAYAPPRPYEGGEGEGWYFIISNLQGRENGWCCWRHIYGKLTDVSR